MTGIDKDIYIRDIDEIKDTLKTISDIQRTSCKRLTELESDVKHHLEISKENHVSKRKQSYYIVGLLGSYLSLGISKLINV